MSGDSHKDDLLNRARDLQRDAGANSRQPEQRSWLQKLIAGFQRINRRLGPVGWMLAWLARLVARWLRWLVFEVDEQDSVRTRGRGEELDYDLAPKRLLWTVPVSAAALISVHVLLSAIYYYATPFQEMVYVTGKQEIETGELYQFGGCTSLPCSTESDNGKFYLIESSLYFPVLLYPEEDVFANIPQQNGACQVEGYGIYFRALRWLYKSLQLYQHVTNVSCRPYTEDEIKRAVDVGDISIPG